MRVGDAKDAARAWMLDNAGEIPGAIGAFFHGSSVDSDDFSPFPETSDIDIIFVIDGPEPIEKPGKFRFENVILDVSFLPREQIQSAEHVLGHITWPGASGTGA